MRARKKKRILDIKESKPFLKGKMESYPCEKNKRKLDTLTQINKALNKESDEIISNKGKSTLFYDSVNVNCYQVSIALLL